MYLNEYAGIIYSYKHSCNTDDDTNEFYTGWIEEFR